MSKKNNIQGVDTSTNPKNSSNSQSGSTTPGASTGTGSGAQKKTKETDKGKKDVRPTKVTKPEKPQKHFEVDSGFLPVKYCKSLAIADAREVASQDIQKYVEANEFQYYLLCNTWYGITQSICGESCAKLLFHSIKKKGLIKVIKLCQDVASNVINGFSDGELYNDETVFLRDTLYPCDNDKEMLQVLRWPKRFSPFNASDIAKNSLISFKNFNNSRKMKEQKGYPYWITSAIRDELAKMLWPYKKVMEDVDLTFARFSPGTISPEATGSSNNGLLNKLDCYATAEPFLYGDPRYPIFSKNGDSNMHRISNLAHRWCNEVRYERPDINPGPNVFNFTGIKALSKKPRHNYQYPMYYYSGRRDVHFMPLYRDTKNPHNICDVRGVPKDWKVDRIIARESSFNQFGLDMVRQRLKVSLIRSGYYDFINLENQKTNQELAIQGSLDGSYATVDLTSASDSFTWTLIQEVFPQAIVDDLMEYSAQFFRIDGKLHPRYIALTMGAPTTMILQSVFYKACAVVAEKLTDFGLDNYTDYHPAYVYGDDCVVDSRIAECFYFVLSKCGFVVNPNKTFDTHEENYSFRESCGIEAIFGWDVSPKYFPRKGIKVSSYSGLIDLQHKTYDYINIRIFMLDVIKKLYPNFTTSSPGSLYGDAWSHDPSCQHRKPKLGDRPTDKKACEVYDASLCEGHLIEAVAKSSHREMSFVQKMNRDMWYYTQYLQFGPMYTSKLDRRLHVSTSRIGSDDTLFGAVTSKATLRFF